MCTVEAGDKYVTYVWSGLTGYQIGLMPRGVYMHAQLHSTH